MIKTILIATDFSGAAVNAARYGMELAKAFNARIVLFNAYHPMPVAVTEPIVNVSPDDMRKDVQRKLQIISSQINSDNAVNAELACEQGSTTGSILKAARDYYADLIVTGMKGQGKAIGKVFGSTVTSLMRKTRVPLIIVPEETGYAAINTIALANEDDIGSDVNIHVLDIFRAIASHFHSRLYLVRISGNQFREAYDVLNPPSRLSRIMKNLHPVYECMEGDNIPGALNEFISKNQVDMLAMMPHHHSLLETWLVKSPTRTMAFKTHIPLLILPGLDDKS